MFLSYSRYSRCIRHKPYLANVLLAAACLRRGSIDGTLPCP